LLKIYNFKIFMKSKTAIIILMAIAVVSGLFMFYLLEISRQEKNISEIKNFNYSNPVNIKENSINIERLKAIQILNEEKKKNPNYLSSEEMENERLKAIQILNEEKKKNPNYLSSEEMENERLRAILILNE